MPAPISRRRFLSLSAITLASAVVGCTPQPQASPAPPAETPSGTSSGAQPSPIPSQPPVSAATPTAPRPITRPNLIYILTDDLDAHSMQFMPQLITNLGEKGLTFTNYLFNFALCCPSRTAVLTGMYAHNSGIYSNGSPDGGYELVRQNNLEQQMLPVWLQKAGYRTALFGKYLNGYPGSGKKADLTLVPPGWTEWYSPAAGGGYAEFKYTLNENGKLVEYGEKPEDYGTDVYARKAADFIDRSVKEGKPFFTYIAPYAPHGPSTPAPRHAELFPGVMAPRTPSFNEAEVSDKPMVIQDRPLLSEKQIQKIDQSYRLRLQSLQAVDEMIGKLVSQLQSLGVLNNTYIFFVSDNGFHLGQHRLENGKANPYEEDIRVPMLVRGPGLLVGGKVEALVGNIDLASTMAYLAGAAIPPGVDGRPLAVFLQDGKPAVWRQAFLLEHGAPVEIPTMPVAGKAKPKAKAWSQGLRTRDYTYVEYQNGERELYDLNKDPYQLSNLATKADQALLKQLSERVNALRKAKGAAARQLEEQPVPALGS